MMNTFEVGDIVTETYVNTNLRKCHYLIQGISFDQFASQRHNMLCLETGQTYRILSYLLTENNYKKVA